MKKTSLLSTQLDDQGNLILPQEVLQNYGLALGAVVRLEQTEQGLCISRSTDSLACVYVEATNKCNFDCRMCMRNAWEEPLGEMHTGTFSLILESIQSFSPLPKIFFGGLGEPLAHPGMLDMIAAAKKLSAEVELITNGTLLNEAIASRLVKLNLNRLWVSIDGATPVSYADIRLGDALPQVLANLMRLQELRAWSRLHLPKLGIAFVAMKRNIADLPKVIRLGKRLGADLFSISNVLPHTEELEEQVLYNLSMDDNRLHPSQWFPEVSLPRMHIDTTAIENLSEALKWRNNCLEITRQPLTFGANSCPFLEKGSISIRWDGEVSPCLPLMHTHKSYLEERQRTSYAYSIGNILNHHLADIWMDPNYVKLRERLQAFDFSPCTFCNSCEMADANLEDCFGNLHPACGGCLWAQGYIQCP
jgi:MoaA/NifB/PqqE/SkfB family radical SAM enzyme